jgi:two-component system, OmpR family, sensor histidine kinase BaeS
MRRLGCLFLLIVLMAVAAGALGVWALGTSVGLIESSHVLRLVATGGVVLGVLLIVALARLLRSLATPVDALVEAAGHIEEGDYSARVDARGPRDLRTLARAFNAMSARLEETDRQRRAYLADVTHELRTPLAVIQGHLEAVLDGVYPADQEHLEPIIEQARTLDGLIEDLRTLTLVETGSLTLRREPLDLAVLINDTVAALRPGASRRAVEIRTEAPTDLPALEADPVRIRSVLANLLTNAIRHTPEGGVVTVRAAVDGPVLRVSVHDTGEGFPADLLPHIFERFVKGPGSEGSGLGLAIARDLIAAHGGTIEARNDPGGGAVIDFGLPLAGSSRAA